MSRGGHIVTLCIICRQPMTHRPQYLHPIMCLIVHHQCVKRREALKNLARLRKNKAIKRKIAIYT